MFLHSSQPAKESLSDDETFVALELEVLDDFASSHRSAGAHKLRNEHLQYLAALHLRGESGLGLQLIDRALVLTDAEPLGESEFVAELLSLQAEMLVATDSCAEAEESLRRAAEASVSPPLTANIALRHAELLIAWSREPDALAVLGEAFDSILPAARPIELVTTLVATYARVGDFEQAETLLGSHIRQLSELHPLNRPIDAAVCRLHLVSLLLEQGKYPEAADAMCLPFIWEESAPQPLVDLAGYYSAVCAAVASGSLLSPPLITTGHKPEVPGPAPQSQLPFPAFERLSEAGTKTWGTQGSLTVDLVHLADIFHAKELDLQGSAYGLFSKGDYDGAVDAFQKLEKWRAESARQGTLIAALDSRAFTFALVRAGRSEALHTSRSARRRLQLLLGMSAVMTLRAVLDEAQILLDHKETAQAGALVRQALRRGRQLPNDSEEILLRLRLVLMEVNTRTGGTQESLRSIESLASEAAALRSTAPDLEAVVRYQAAAAKASNGDFDAAEHEFVALRRDLEGSADPDLASKATYGLARVMQHRGEYAHALSLLRTLSDSGSNLNRPLSLKIRQRIAECLTSLKEHSSAADIYRSCADDLFNWADDKDPDYLDMRLLQADCLLASGQYKAARRIYRMIWETLHKDYSGRDVFFIRAVMGNGTCLRRLKDYSGAVLNYTRVHDLQDKREHMSQDENLDLERWLAWSLEMSGALEDAAQHYSETIRLLDELYPEQIGLIEDLRFRVLCCTGRV